MAGAWSGRDTARAGLGSGAVWRQRSGSAESAVHIWAVGRCTRRRGPDAPLPAGRRLLNADVSRTSVDESDTYESVGVLLAQFRCAREAVAQATPKASLLDTPTVRLSQSAEPAAQPPCSPGARSEESGVVNADAATSVTVTSVTAAAAALAPVCAPPAEVNVTLEDLAFDKLALDPPGTPPFADGSLKRLGGRISARLSQSLRRVGDGFKEVGDGLKEQLEKLESKLS